MMLYYQFQQKKQFKNKKNLVGYNKLYLKEVFKMDNNQKIKCTVCSCKYNGIEDCNCQLEQITIKPYPDDNSRNPDETICSNYKCAHK